MVLSIERDPLYKDKVLAMDIHGKHPYKLYLEVKGNSNIGKYIVIISNKQLNKDEKIDSVSIKLDAANKQLKNANTAIIKPNMSLNGYHVTYKVRESTILEIGDTPILVYKSSKEK